MHPEGVDGIDCRVRGSSPPMRIKSCPLLTMPLATTHLLRSPTVLVELRRASARPPVEGVRICQGGGREVKKPADV